MRNRTSRAVGVLVLGGVVAALGVAGGWSGAGSGDGKLEFARTRMYIEYNASAGDVGVQVDMDGEPWRELRVFRPDGRMILELRGRNSLALQGFTELFFESSEPPLAQVPLKEFFRRFPRGEYEFEGKTLSGEEIEGVALFTHAIPAKPVVLLPVNKSVQDPEDTVVQWLPVPNPPGSVISAYQVTVTQILDVVPKRVFSVHVPAWVTRVLVTPEFMQHGAAYEFEVLAIERGGNQTIHAGEFTTSP